MPDNYDTWSEKVFFFYKLGISIQKADALSIHCNSLLYKLWLVFAIDVAIEVNESEESPSPSFR